MTLEEALTTIGKNTVADARANLRSKNKNATGRLYNSLKAVVENSELAFEMEKYGRWVDEGRRPGKYAPVKSILDWCRQRGIERKYAFVINRAIKEHGIKPTFFFTKALERNEAQLDKLLDQYVDGLMTSYIDIEL